jgi:hypothetical protein
VDRDSFDIASLNSGLLCPLCGAPLRQEERVAHYLKRADDVAGECGTSVNLSGQYEEISRTNQNQIDLVLQPLRDGHAIVAGSVS